MKQPDLFSIGAYGAEPAYQAHSDTSREAAEEIKVSLNALQEAVFAYIRGRGDDGATDEEGCVALKMNPSTYRPRRSSLSLRIAPGPPNRPMVAMDQSLENSAALHTVVLVPLVKLLGTLFVTSAR